MSRLRQGRSCSACSVSYTKARPASVCIPCCTQGPSAHGIAWLHVAQAGAPKNPRAVAEAIVAHLPASPMLGEPPSLAGPGFINVRLSLGWIAARIRHMLQRGPAHWAPRSPYRRAVVDFSSPNVAKEMHVGHLRSTIIGDTLCCTLEYCGIDVLRINHTVCCLACSQRSADKMASCSHAGVLSPHLSLVSLVLVHRHLMSRRALSLRRATFMLTI